MPGRQQHHQCGGGGMQSVHQVIPVPGHQQHHQCGGAVQQSVHQVVSVPGHQQHHQCGGDGQQSVHHPMSNVGHSCSSREEAVTCLALSWRPMICISRTCPSQCCLQYHCVESILPPDELHHRHDGLGQGHSQGLALQQDAEPLKEHQWAL